MEGGMEGRRGGWVDEGGGGGGARGAAGHPGACAGMRRWGFSTRTAPRPPPRMRLAAFRVGRGRRGVSAFGRGGEGAAMSRQRASGAEGGQGAERPRWGPGGSLRVWRGTGRWGGGGGA